LWLALLSWFVAMPAAAQEPMRTSSRSANYTMRVSFDPAHRRLEGVGSIRWRNVTARPIGDLVLRLYYNSRRDSDDSSIEITEARAAGMTPDLAAALDFGAAGGHSDKTIARATLARPIEPGGEGQVDIRWTATLPRTAASDQLFLAAGWFPQLAVLTGDGWVVRDGMAAPDAFSDFGEYDVTITAPAGWQVAATGHRTREDPGRHATQFVQHDARGFAWAASPRWLEHHERVERTGAGPVDLHLVLQPEHAGQMNRFLAAIRAALAAPDPALTWYPYRDLTVMDLPWNSPYRSVSFPGFVAVTTRWIEPFLTSDVEASVAQAMTRHSWQQIVAPDAIAYRPFVDGMSAYLQSRLQRRLVERHLNRPAGEPFVVQRFFGGFIPYPIRGVVDTPPFDARQTDAASARVALALATMERYLGWPAFEAVLTEYHRRYTFAHPSPDAFFAVANEVSGRDLGWFFDQSFGGSAEFDYGVAAVTESTQQNGATRRYRTAVTIRRNGDAVFSGSSRARVDGFQSGRAVVLLAEFGDASTLTDHWDGREREKSFEYESAAPLVRVTIDPRRVLMLDGNRTNNTWARTPRAATASTHWASRWLVWLEDLLLTYSLFV
jgi:hypothetical protein